MASKSKAGTNRAKRDKNTLTRILHVLQAARDDDEVHKISVTRIGRSDESIMVKARPNKHHVVKVQLEWIKVGTAHYTGYFVLGEKMVRPAIVSLYNQYDAAQFIVAVKLLGEIAAKVPRKPRAISRRSVSRR